MTSRRRGVALAPMRTRREVIAAPPYSPTNWGMRSSRYPRTGDGPAPVLTEIALRTARICLASGVLPVWGRTPAPLAMTAATLHQLCGGRYVLSLDASTKPLAEGFHDTAFEHPAAKLRHVMTKVRALLAGQPAQLGHAPAAPAAPGPAARPRGTHLGRRAGPSPDPGGRRAR